jgi:hypothetical protein
MGGVEKRVFGYRALHRPTIETALALRLLFRLPLRQAKGFVRSILTLMGLDLPCPDHKKTKRGGNER